MICRLLTLGPITVLRESAAFTLLITQHIQTWTEVLSHVLNATESALTSLSIGRFESAMAHIKAKVRRYQCRVKQSSSDTRIFLYC